MLNCNITVWNYLDIDECESNTTLITNASCDGEDSTCAQNEGFSGSGNTEQGFKRLRYFKPGKKYL